MELHWMSASALARGFETGRLSPVEYVSHLLKRIEQHDPSLNVFIRLDGDAAMDAARQAEKEIRVKERRGALAGLPVAVKDIIDVAGVPTTAHSRVLPDVPAADDAAVVARVRRAGGIPFGKVATHEFAIGGPSFDLPFPPARNPWNRDHHPGGSSSGSGAGLAAGFFPLAFGTDTGGSIRNPATNCGVVGLKPTYGLVPRRGVFPLAYTLDHVGPLARTVADAALMLDAIAGYDPADPGSSPGPDRSFAHDLRRGIRGFRVGYVRHFHERDMPATNEVAAALDEATRVLRGEGAIVSDVTLPDLNEFSAVNRVILQSEAWSIHAPMLRARPGDYGQLGRQRLMPGAFMTAEDYIGAQRRRLQMIEAVQNVFDGHDLLLCASSMDPPCRIDDADAVAKTYPRQARTPFNVTGHPAIAMMAGLSSTGLPIGLQLVGPYFEDGTVLRAAAAFERATDWHTRHPSL
jgi:aspartyl-tRNA(Asn)/glutamyl-tRNA(Gln) amidotransferase subunit A